MGGRAGIEADSQQTSQNSSTSRCHVLNCSGVKLDEQDKVYAGHVTGGTVFPPCRPYAARHTHHCRYMALTPQAEDITRSA